VKVLAVLIATLAFAAPASALEPPPHVIKFAAGQLAPITQDGAHVFGECTSPTVATGGWDGGAYLDLTCGDPFISFDQPQAMVELFVRSPHGNTVTFRACPGGESSCTIATQTVTGSGWTPVVLADPNGAATIDHIDADSPMPDEMWLDDIAFSTVRQPGTDIAALDATTFALSSSASGATFQCSVDRGDFAPCTSPVALGGLAAGAHSLAAFAVDVYGAADNRTPARVDFTVPAPPPPPLVTDTDRDGIPDASDNCPAVANSDQTDGDKDGVGNACDTLPPGNVPPEVGESSVVQVLSGRPPSSACAACARRSRTAASSR
jgi:Thrombospondin type 3 repeat